MFNHLSFSVFTKIVKILLEIKVFKVAQIFEDIKENYVQNV